MPWFVLFLAGVFEIGWAIALKYSEGLTRPLPAVLTVVSMTLSLLLLGNALRTLPLGTAYAIWTGIGAIGTAVFGVYLFHEPVNPGRIFCIAMIVLGIMGLKWFSTT